MFRSLFGQLYPFTVTVLCDGLIDDERNLTRNTASVKIVVMAYDFNDAEKQAFKSIQADHAIEEYDAVPWAWSTSVIAVERGGKMVKKCGCKCK